MRIRETLKRALIAGGVAGTVAVVPASALMAQQTTAPSAQPGVEAPVEPGKLPDGIKAPANTTAPGSGSAGTSTIERSPAASPSDKAAQAPADGKLVGLPVYTSDGQRIGRVSAVAMGTDGSVKEIHAKVGGFFGFGATLVRIEPDKFEKAGRRVQLSLNAKQAEELPKVEKPSQS